MMDICRRSKMVLLLLAGSTWLAPAVRGGEIARGKDIATGGGQRDAPICGDCHGARGEGQIASGAPRLAGLDAGYLQRQLAAFSMGTRDNAVMGQIAVRLGGVGAVDVAAYYASLPAPVASALPRDENAIARGRSVALNGDWGARIPACAACHGLRGLGVGAMFPALAGQGAGYLASQLGAWRQGTRRDDALGLMGTIAKRLDDRQIAAVAAYYADLAPGGTGRGEGVPHAEPAP